MKDVARKANVSVTTVSHVLNGSRFVSDEARGRVLDAMDELAYKRNALARSLRQKHSHTIGLILPDATNPFFAEVARSVSDESSLRGYSMIICNTDGDGEKEERFFRILTEKQVDGIILIEAGASRGAASSIGKLGIPTVMMDRFSRLDGVDTLRIDNAGGGALATRRLLSLGHRRIACVAGPSDVTPSAERVSGYRTALTEAGIPFREEYVLKGDFHPESGYEATIFRDGLAYEVFWKTPQGDKPIQFVDAQGNPFHLKPGNTWIAIFGLSSPTVVENGDWSITFNMP